MMNMLTLIAQTFDFGYHGPPRWLVIVLVLGAGAFFKALINGGSQTPSEPASPPKATPSPQVDPRKVKERELYANDLTRVAIGVLAKFAKADGIVTKQEVRVLDCAFVELGLVGEARQQAISVFNEAKTGPLTYAEVIDLFAQLSPGAEQARVTLVLLLLHLAHADGSMSGQAVQLLQQACTVLGCGYQQCLSFFRASHEAKANQLKAAYELLGCVQTDNDERIRQRYKVLVREFHPDTLTARGLSAEFTRFAEEKFKQIQAAYEWIVEQRKATGSGH